MSSTPYTYTIPHIHDIVARLYEQYKDYHIWVFIGEMGAGKTTLIKSLCQYMGIVDMVNSPTFNIIKIYEHGDIFVSHIDLYRLKSLEDALSIDIEEALSNTHYCFIEWPQIIYPLLAHRSYVEIDIQFVHHDERKISTKVLTPDQLQ